MIDQYKKLYCNFWSDSKVFNEVLYNPDEAERFFKLAEGLIYNNDGFPHLPAKKHGDLWNHLSYFILRILCVFHLSDERIGNLVTRILEVNPRINRPILFTLKLKKIYLNANNPTKPIKFRPDNFTILPLRSKINTMHEHYSQSWKNEVFTLLDALNEILQSSKINGEILLFGSRLIGSCIPNSDFDFVYLRTSSVDSQMNYKALMEIFLKSAKESKLKKLEKPIKTLDETNEMLLEGEYSNFGLKSIPFDISFDPNAIFSLISCMLLECYFKLDSRVQELVWIIRSQFMPMQKVFPILHSVIFFLQNTKPPVLPNLQQPPKWVLKCFGIDELPSEYIDGINIWYLDPTKTNPIGPRIPSKLDILSSYCIPNKSESTLNCEFYSDIWLYLLKTHCPSLLNPDRTAAELTLNKDDTASLFLKYLHFYVVEFDILHYCISIRHSPQWRKMASMKSMWYLSAKCKINKGEKEDTTEELRFFDSLSYSWEQKTANQICTDAAKNWTYGTASCCDCKHTHNRSLYKIKTSTHSIPIEDAFICCKIISHVESERTGVFVIRLQELFNLYFKC